MRMPRIGLLLIAALALSGTTFGQGGDSSLRGTIADESGAVLPGVTITATSLALISAATAVSDSSGTYRLLNLPPGDYVLESSLSGFATVRQEGIVLRAGVIFDVNVTMTISTIQETVTVTAETPMMEISRPSNILNVEGEFQRDVPIQARGNWSDFLEMTPGVNARPFDDGSGRMVYFGHGTEHFAHVIQIEGMAAAGYTDAQVTYVGMGHGHRRRHHGQDRRRRSQGSDGHWHHHQRGDQVRRQQLQRVGQHGLAVVGPVGDQGGG